MATRKRKTLPKDFDQLLESASLAELIAVFDTCQLDATGGYSKRTALGFYNCPDALVRWLVAQGADIDARDEYLGTALHCRSSSWMGGVDLLLDLGADIEARDRRGNTPLHAAIQSHKAESVAALVRRGADTRAPGRNGESIMHLALATTSNGDIVEMAQIARILLDAGVPSTTRTVPRSGVSALPSSFTGPASIPSRCRPPMRRSPPSIGCSMCRPCRRASSMTASPRSP